MPQPKNVPASPTPIQVVFQGGGAKLCLLMAVVEKLQKYEADGYIKINRAAGSSAGAIAAVMLASKKPMEAYKAKLKLIAPTYLASLKTSWWRGAWRVYSGRAYFEGLSLADFFRELFCTDGGPQNLNDLPIGDTGVYYTDLYSLGSKSVPADAAIPTALAKSCRFPFAFVGFGSGNQDVDGGLAHNLPVDLLKQDESTLGTVIGVSFLSRFGDENKSDVLSYTQQLFSAAIQSSVSRSEAILTKQHVFQIDTNIGTFDFDLALGEGLGIHYQLTAEKFENWLKEWLGGDAGSMSPHKNKLLRPVLTDSPWPQAVVQDLDDRLQAEPSTRAVYVGNFDTAKLDDNGDYTGKYRTKSVKIFKVARPTNILQFDFQIGKEGSFDATNLRCSVFNNLFEPLAFVSHVQERRVSHTALRSFRVYFLFDQRLLPDSPNQPYRAEYEFEGDDPYPRLGIGREVSALAMWQGSADEAVLCVAFPWAKLKSPRVVDIEQATPEQLKDAQYEREREVLVSSAAMAPLEVANSMGLGPQNAQNYYLVGRRVVSIKQGEGFGFVIERSG